MMLRTSKNRAGWWWHIPLISALGRQRLAGQGQPGLQSKFQESQGYTEKPKKKKKKRQNKTKDMKKEGA